MEELRQAGITLGETPELPAASEGESAAAQAAASQVAGPRLRARPASHWLWLGLPPLASLLALLLQASLYQPPAPATGDKLLDTCYRQFDARGFWPWSSALNSINKPSLPLLRELDPSLTDDPRYWLLLYHHGKPGIVGHPQLGNRQPTLTSSGAQLLQQARAQGVVSPRLLEMLADDYLEECQRTLPRVPAPPSATRSKVSERSLSEWSERDRPLAQVARAGLEPLITELLASGPQDATAHYFAARLWSEVGEYGRALDAVRSGNALEQQSSMLSLGTGPFWHTASPPARQWAVEEAVFGNFFTRSLPNYVEWKDMFYRLTAHAAEQGDLDGLQELHVLACRMALMDQDLFINQLVALVNVRMIARSLQHQPALQLSEAELRGTAVLLTRLANLQQTIRSNIQQSRVSSGPGAALLAYTTGQGGIAANKQALATLLFVANAPASQLQLFHGLAESERSAARQTVADWEALARIDLRELDKLAAEAGSSAVDPPQAAPAAAD